MKKADSKEEIYTTMHLYFYLCRVCNCYFVIERRSFETCEENGYIVPFICKLGI